MTGSLDRNFWNDQEIVQYFSDKPADLRVASRLMRLKKKLGLKALDLGCGSGRHTQLLLALSFSTYACDVNSAMIEATRKRIEHLLSPKLIKRNIVFGSITCIPFPSNFFDLVVTTGVLHQAASLEEYKHAIKELSRVTKLKAVLCLNIFTNKVMDDTYRKVKGEKYTVITKEGLFMTLLPKELFIQMMYEQGFRLEEELAEDIKQENTGPRAVFRANFIKG